MTPELHFPVWILLESKSLGTPSPATCIRDGKLCLALFDDCEVELQFRAEELPAGRAIGTREKFTEDELRFFLNQYNDVAVNPCSKKEAILASQELCDYLNQRSEAP